MGRTQEERKADTRARLLSAASDLFAHKGFHAVSAEAVAEAADRTTGALYSHFGNKEGLLLALMEEWLAQTADALGAELDDRADPEAIVRAMWATVVAGDGIGPQDWVLLELELWLHGARDPQIGSPLAERYRRVRTDLGAALAHWAEVTGVSLRQPPEVLAALLVGLVIGSAVQYRIDSTALGVDHLVAVAHALIGAEPPRSTT